MGELLCIYIAIAIITISSITGIFLSKNIKSLKIFTNIYYLIALVIGFISFTAIPSNYITQKIIAIVLVVLVIVIGRIVYTKKSDKFN